MKYKIVPYLFLFLFIACNDKETGKGMEKADDTSHGSTNHSYYTCPMHPQIHEHKSGSCPICGMPLVKVAGAEKATSSKHSILPTDYQKSVIGFTKGKVQKREVSFDIPSAGRLLSSRQVAFYVYESDILNIKAGLQFEGECSSMPGEVLKGKITHIDTIADPSSRAVRVIGDFSSTHNLKLIEGSFFGKIKFSPVIAMMIPYDAVLRTGKEDLVYKISDDQKLYPVKVTLGRTQGDEVEVIQGLNENDTISFGPNFLIDSEARLKGMGSMEGMEGMGEMK
ncbi:MAG TPA: heavy metal-binding domain-containing protein [Bacteriovoracaceae bacterium]|nr:heavy metal-binding domain-containing protein [Bacteriovoracaceae bacterium]